MVHPVPEIDVTEPLVRALLREQHPDLADLPLTWAGTGWDNALWRLGDDLAVAVPRAGGRRAPRGARADLAPGPGAQPAGRRARSRSGSACRRRPTRGRGASSRGSTPSRRTTRRSPSGRPGRCTSPRSSSRCTARRPTTPRSTRSAASRSPANRSSSGSATLDLPDADRILERFRDLARRARDWDGPPLWLHGDPHPANLLVHDGAPARGDRLRRHHVGRPGVRPVDRVAHVRRRRPGGLPRPAALRRRDLATRAGVGAALGGRPPDAPGSTTRRS